MSVLGILVYILVLIACCAVSWKAALRRNNRNRDARNEDPRDQEIRELSAALSISRKELDRIGSAKSTGESEINELKNKLQHTSDALEDTQQKFNATKDTLNHEIEARQELNAEIQTVEREVEVARTRAAELEVQVKMSSHGSGMVAGFDVEDEDDEAAEKAQQRIDEMEQEATRWKQHCAVLSQSNKSLRIEANELKEALAAAATQAPTDSVPDNTDTLPTMNVAERTDDNSSDQSLQKDDLKSIRGVGEKLEQKLHLLGIFSFRSIVSIDDGVLERANLVIPNLQQRLDRESWLDQARALHLEKYNELI